MEAEHDTNLPCLYDGESKERQIDGYKEIKMRPFVTIKVAIECKRWNGPVEGSNVDSFRTIMQDCKFNVGIFVSFKGFQPLAIASAKKGGIYLYHFRPCSKDDIDMTPFNKIIGAKWDHRFISRAPAKSMSKEERALISMRDSKYVDRFLYNREGEKVIEEDVFIQDLIQPEILEKGYTADILNVDLSERMLYFKAKFGDRKVFLKIESVEIVFRKTFDWDIVNPEDWFILEDVIDGNVMLVDRIYVEKIRAAYDV